jgi:transposase
LGLDDETVYRIDKCMLEKLAQEKLDSLVAPTMMSVDEVSWQKRHKDVTNVIDIQKRKVIWNHNDRGKYVLDKFYRKLGPEGCENIQAVASDGARSFLSSTKAFAKNALIVLDHFHVKKCASTMCWIQFTRKNSVRPQKRTTVNCFKSFIAARDSS